MEKNSLSQNLHQIGGIGTLIIDDSDDVLRGAANFTGISGKTMLEEMSRTHPTFVNIGGSEGYTGAETPGGGAEPDAIPATEEALANRKLQEEKNKESNTGSKSNEDNFDSDDKDN